MGRIVIIIIIINIYTNTKNMGSVMLLTIFTI